MTQKPPRRLKRAAQRSASARWPVHPCRQLRRKGRERVRTVSLQGGFHLVDKLAAPLVVSLRIHVGVRPLNHGEALHAQNVVLQEGLLGLEAGREIEDVLDVLRRADLLAQLLELVDALRRGVVDGLADRLLGPGLAGDALELRGVEGIAGVLGVVAVVPQIAVDRRREATGAGALDQALDLREFRRQIFPELRGVQEARDVIDVGELVEGIRRAASPVRAGPARPSAARSASRPASSSRSAARTGGRRRSGRKPGPALARPAQGERDAGTRN